MVPESLTADAGYGSEENYDFLEEKGITAYVKYGYFDKEQRDRKYRENPFNADNLHYNPETDTYTCPMRGPCHKAAGNRIIQRSPNLNRHRQKTKELLMSEEGIEKRKQR